MIRLVLAPKDLEAAAESSSMAQDPLQAEDRKAQAVGSIAGGGVGYGAGSGAGSMASGASGLVYVEWG